MSDKIMLFESADSTVTLDVAIDGETAWLSQAQMAELFQKDQSVISRHINNVFKEGELAKEGNMHYLHIASSDRPVAYYNLDVIISVGYRVKSKRGVEFRRWATGVLFSGGRKAIDDATLVAVTVMIAESKPEEKEAMIALVMNFLVMGRNTSAALRFVH